jgi:hypothetical protein
MPLTDRQERKFLAWLKQRNISTDCSTCAAALVRGRSEFVTLAAPDPSGTPVAPSLVPLVMLVCSNCGSTRLFSLAVMSWVPEEFPPDVPACIPHLADHEV